MATTTTTTEKSGSREERPGKEDSGGIKESAAGDVETSPHAPKRARLEHPLVGISRVEVPDVPGLSLWRGFISVAEEAALLRSVNAAQWSSALRRRTQHYGFEYDYRTRQLPARLGPLPDWSNALVERMLEREIYARETPPNQLIVNEYTPGQGISAHTDSPVFASPIVSVSLGSVVVMDFSLPASAGAPAKTVNLVLPRRSAIVLSGEARSRWRHAIAARYHDVYSGMRHERTTRVSLTFRIVPSAL